MSIVVGLDVLYMSILALLVFYIGASVASFLMVVMEEAREGQWKRMLVGHSLCNYCKKKLARYELIPVLSHIIQRGACRSCKKAIPRRYFRTESVFGITTVALVYILGYIYGIARQEILFWAGMLWSLLAISISDILRYELPLSVWIGGVIRTMLRYGGYLSGHGYGSEIWSWLARGVGISLVLYGISYVVVYLKTQQREEGMGLGDVFLIPRIAVLYSFVPLRLSHVMSYLGVNVADIMTFMPTRFIHMEVVLLWITIASIWGLILRILLKPGKHIPFLPALILAFLTIIL